MANDIVGKLLAGQLDTNFDAIGQAGQGYKDGVKLAAIKQQTENQKQQVAAQKDALVQRQFAMVDGTISKLQKMSPAARKRYAKMMGPQLERAGIPVSQASLADFEDEEARNNYLYLKNSGILKSLGLQGQKEAIEALAQEQGWSPTVNDLKMQVQKNLEAQRNFQQSSKIKQMEVGNQLAKEERVQDRSLDKETRSIGLRLNKEVTTRSKKDADALNNLRLAKSMLERVREQVLAGERPDEISSRVGSRVFAKAMSGGGTMTDADVDDFRGQIGFKGKAEDFFNEYISGNQSQRTIDQLLENMGKTIDTKKQNLDRELTSIDKSVSALGLDERRQNAVREASGISSYREFLNEDFTNKLVQDEMELQKTQVMNSLKKKYPNVPEETLRAQVEQKFNSMSQKKQQAGR